jgi:hypothetical protein
MLALPGHIDCYTLGLDPETRQRHHVEVRVPFSHVLRICSLTLAFILFYNTVIVLEFWQCPMLVS